MTDLYFTESGDIEVAPNGDIALTQSDWRDDVQAAYIRMMTDIGDFDMNLEGPGGKASELGADLSRLYGRPQSQATGQYGVQLITSALERGARFVGKPVTVEAVPTGHQTIRFDVFIKSGSQSQIKLSVEQDLGVA